MCSPKVTMLRELMKQQLNVAVEGILQLFETTILQYEEELQRTKEEKARQDELLHAVVKDSQEVLPESPEAGRSEPQQYHKDECLQTQSLIKTEEKNIQSCQDGDQLTKHKMKEAGINTLPLTDFKCDQDQGEASQFHYSQTVETRSHGKANGQSVEKLSQGEANGKRCKKSNKEHKVSSKPDGAKVTLANSKGAVPHPTNSKSFSLRRTTRRINQPQHSRPHTSPTGSQQFSCPICKKNFSRKYDLNEHAKIHTGVKPHVCTVCGFAFLRRYHLKRHMGTHKSHKSVPSQNDSNSCLVCAKGFLVKGNLERHMKTHTGDKPFSCDACGKRFPRNDILKSHIVHCKRDK
ncbi:zinc finger protein 436-like isoform X2 [Syngnathus typhle]|uniref:zinc finger protein 436-like isoform X2 n=1 Tax=Syngnathus typhle TaxID=161592 RepID=UPI002A699493|nr:zinc finger protein 436-like isoform X2 [Syngnathus typhle]